MERLLGKYSDYVYAILRIVVGLLFAYHGAQKVLGVLGGAGGKGGTVALLSLIGVAGLIELLGGVLVMIGLFADYAAFLASGQMAVAYFMAHASKGFWPIQNGGELAVLYCFIFLYIAVKGNGIWGLGPSSKPLSENAE